MTATRTVADRRARLVEAIKQRGLDAAVLNSYENVSYLGGTHVITQLMVPDRLVFVVIGSDSESTLLVCNIEESQVRSQTDLVDLRSYVEFLDDPTVSLVTLLRERAPLRSLGFEARRLPASALLILQNSLPDTRLVPIDALLDELQGVKEKDEIEVLQSGGLRTLDAVLQVTSAAGAGSTERAISNQIHLKLVESGGDPTFLVFACGSRTMHGHPEPRDTPMQAGSIWRVDLGARYQWGFNSDLARTGVVGEPSSEQESILSSLREGQDAAIRLAEPGRKASELFDACRSTLAKRGLPFAMPHIGHGIGIGLHEQPMLEPANKQLLKSGMVLNIEPMVVMTDRGEAYHTEDLILVTEGGPSLLTTPQKSLLRIAAR